MLDVLVAGFGLKVAEDRLGTPLALSETEPVKLLLRVTVTE
jgi:hypothetical protein